MKDCLFCRIFRGEIPSSKVYESPKVMAFKDLHPLAPVHVLFIHQEHSHNVNELTTKPECLQDLFSAIADYTQKEKLDESGFRIVTNVGPHGGQTIFHTHFHVLGGTQLKGFGA
ncbi:MAG: HIT domain-containing protein [Bacteriovoracaceae bacterium]